MEVWQIGKEMTIDIYNITGKFPKEETYGITSQIRRSSLSVPANIAEGFGRFHFMDKAKFYLNARGSLYELKSHLMIAEELGFIETKLDDIFKKVEVLSLKLNNLIDKTRSLKKSL